MLAKIIVRGEIARAALAQTASRAGRDATIAGIETNLAYLRQICRDPAFAAGGVTTRFLQHASHVRGTRHRCARARHADDRSGLSGRSGYWHVGVPPSGPMDSLAFRLANRWWAMPRAQRALEITVTGPTLRFADDTRDRARRRRFQARRSMAQPFRDGQLVSVGSGFRARDGAASSERARALIWPSRAASMCRSIWAAGAPSSSGNSAAMRDARCAPAMCCTCGRDASGQPPVRYDCTARVPTRVGHRRALRPARRARFLHRRRHRDVLLDRVESSLQFRPHRRPADRAEAAVGAQGWRRSRAASVEHSRQRLRRSARSISPATCR